MEIVSKRPAVYDALFGSELQYMSDPALEEVSLSGLWRLYTRKSGIPSKDFGEHLELVPEIVDDILTAHNNNARCGKPDGRTIYSVPDPGILKTVAEITTRTMSLWEKAIWRRQGGLLFAPPDGGTYQKKEERFLQYTGIAAQCTIETGAAALRSLAVYSRNPFRLAGGDKQKIAAVLANWGPEFLHRWMNGTVVEDWLAHHGRDREIEQWREVCTPSLLKAFLRQDTTNPLHGFEKFWTKLEGLSDAAIAKHLRWSETEVAEFITPGVRRAFAKQHIDPFKALNKLKANMQLMTDENLACKLGWTTEEARAVLPPSRRRQIALLNPQDPLATARKVKENVALLNDEEIAKRVGWPIEKVAELFTTNYRYHIALNYLVGPLDAAERMARNFEALNYQAVAEYLGWPIEHACLIPTGKLREYALMNITDPFAPLSTVRAVAASLTSDAIAERLRVPLHVARQRVPIIDRRKAALECKTPEEALQKIKQSYGTT